jgi:hypothetical protein
MSSDPDRFDQADRIQAEWRRERPDLDVGPHGAIGRLLRLSGIQTERFELLYKRFGLNLGEFAEHVRLEHRLVDGLKPAQVARLEELPAVWPAAVEPHQG